MSDEKGSTVIRPTGCTICGGTGSMRVFNSTVDVEPRYETCYCRKPFEHIASVKCHCGPQLIYTAPDGSGVYIHVEKQ